LNFCRYIHAAFGEQSEPEKKIQNFDEIRTKISPNFGEPERAEEILLFRLRCSWENIFWRAVLDRAGRGKPEGRSG